MRDGFSSLPLFDQEYSKMSSHRTLMSSSLLAAIAGVSLMAAAPAQGAVTIYTDAATMSADLTGAGAVQTFVEDFENHDPTNAYGYSILSNPLNGNPNGVFTGGINPGLELRTDNGNGLSVNTPGPYNGNITSSVVGAFQGYTNLIVDPIADDVVSIGMTLWGIGSFISSPMNAFDYTVYNLEGAVIASGNFPAPDAADMGTFFGIASDGEAIGHIEISGTAFGLSANEYVDDVGCWNMPSTCASDITGPGGSADGNVDALDYLLLLSQWGSPCTVGGCEADITGPTPYVADGNVDSLDFLLLISEWGTPGNCGQ
jgi:hypothetical protein